MIPRRLALGILVLVASAADAETPILRVRAACPGDPPVSSGQTRAISVDFAGMGQQVGAFALTLRFDPAALGAAPVGVVVGEALTSIGATVSVDDEAPSGTLRLLAIPPFSFPVAAVPDGEVIRATFRVAPEARGGCAMVQLAEASFSDTLAGLGIPGSTADGAVAIVPPCPVCNDGDVCNGIESCDSTTGRCQSGAALDCDDCDVCSKDRCEPSSACVHDAQTGFASARCSFERPRRGGLPCRGGVADHVPERADPDGRGGAVGGGGRVDAGGTR